MAKVVEILIGLILLRVSSAQEITREIFILILSRVYKLIFEKTLNSGCTKKYVLLYL